MICIAILNNLIVNGTARFLNKLYANDIDIGGTATFASLSTTGNATIGGTLSVTGATTQTGKFTVNNVIEQHGNGIELYYSTPHIDFHYGNNTADYTSRIIESAQGVITITPKLSTPNASITTGSITTLNAQTIYAKDVDVSDTLKSYKWDISHVANLANDFTVSPTLQLASGATIKFSAINTSTRVCTFTVTDSSSISSDSLGGVTWTQYSKVKFTMNLNDIVNSNCDGYLTVKMNSTSGTMTISGILDNVTGLNTTTNYNAEGATIMLYEVGAGSQSTTYPVGIRMTAYGSNKRSYIDIYGGTATSSWNTPHLRIGNVGGLTFNGSTLENQWGIYTDRGYFSGAIVSTEGKIGGFYIDQTNIHNAVTSLTDTSHTGIYLGTDGIRNYNTTGSKHVTIKDGTITANSVNLSGTITAQGGYIGGFHITSSVNSDTSANGGHVYGTSLWRHSGDGTTYEYEVGIKGDATENPSSANTQGGNLAFYAKRIVKGAKWNTSENMFYVTHDGRLYAKSADIEGKITATSGFIGSYKIDSQYLQAADRTTGMSIKDDSNTKDWAFWAGGTTKETAKFRVTHDGDLYAQSLFVNIGGRNLIKGTQNPVISSTESQYTWTVRSGGNGTGTIETVTDSPVPSVSRSFRITGNTSGNKDFVQKTDEFQKNWGGQWTFSAYVRGIGGNATVLIRSWNNTDNNAALNYTKTVGTSWEKVIVRIPIDVSWDSSASASDSLDIRFGMTGAGAIEYIAPKFEQGIVATDWSPAPEDSITSWKVNANDIKNESTSQCTFSVSNDVVTVTRLNSTNVFGCYYDLPCKPNKYYSASMRVTAGGTGFDFYFGGDYGSGSVWTGMGVAFQREANGIRRATIFKPTSSTQTYLRIYIGSRTQNSTISFRDLTVYEGDDLMMVDKDAADAATTATNYITQIDSNGIWITPSGKKPTNTSTGAGATGTKIDGTNGVQIYNNGTKIAEYGSAISIGNTSGTNNNVLIDDEGMKIKNGPSTVLAKFTSSGAVIGKTSSAQITLNSNTMQLSDKNGNVFFKAYNASGDNGYVTNYFAGDGEKKTFTLQYTAVSSTYVVTVNGETASPTKTNSNFTFTNPPEDGAAIVAQYYAAWGAVSYDLGIRKSNTVTGSYSLIQGKDLVASGKYSFATGENCEANGESSFAGGYYCKAAGYSFAYGTYCEATGSYSVALGHHSIASGLQSYAMGNVAIAKAKGSAAIGNLTTAASRDQTVVGSANVEDTEGKYVFIVGNGKYPNYTRSNALTVDWDGGLQCGNIKCGVFQVDNCNAYAMRNITITFSKPFKTGELPCVVAMFAGGAGSYTFGNVQLSVSERSNTSFTIRIYNATNTAISPYVHWIATTSGQQ